MTTRILKWQSAFNELVASRANIPFKWGSMDCCMFAADCVRAITDEDPAADLRGSYASEVDAVELVRSLGGIAAIAASHVGEEISLMHATVGDVVMAVVDDRETLTIYGGSGMLLAPGPEGVTNVPASLGLKAWRCTKD